MSMHKTPEVGQVVKVTTRYPSYYIYDDNEFQENTYEGKVLRPERWLKENEFMMTGDGRASTRVINMMYVREIEILS